MPIHFTCPHCGTKSQAADQYAGQSGPCVACGKPVTIPYASGGGGAAVGTSVVAIVAVVLVAGFCGVGILVALLLPAVQAAREAARRTTCKNNLRQIALAMQNYHDANNCLPPAFVADKDGRPMHSWRVLILPYMEEANLYDQYNFDEPWDSPNNLRVAEHMPHIYGCPSDPKLGTTTDYMVIVGKETPFHGSKPGNFGEVSDGTSNTIMVIEVKGAGVKWTEPKDLDFATSSFTVFKGPPGDMGSYHIGGAHAAMCDGSVRFLGGAANPATIRSLVTKAGGERVEY